MTHPSATLAEFAAREGAPEPMRLEALDMLADWAKPSPKDRVLNFWRPLAEREPQAAREAVQRALPGFITSQGKIREEGLKLAAKLGIDDAAPALRAMAADTSGDARARAAALQAFALVKSDEAKQVASVYLTDKAALVRSAARAVLAEVAPNEIKDELARVVAEGEISERQAALATLATMKHSAADEIIGQALEALGRGTQAKVTLPAEIELDVLSAAEARSGELKQRVAGYYESLPTDSDPLARYRPALVGGDAEAGRRIFYERTQVSCVRCHKIGERGGEVGPELSKIAREKDRRYLLESIVIPNAQIAKNFETVVLADEEGNIHSGIIRHENDESITLITAENELITIEQEAITARKSGVSAMPDDVVKQLTMRELRDLVEFLAQQK